LATAFLLLSLSFRKWSLSVFPFLCLVFFKREKKKTKRQRKDKKNRDHKRKDRAHRRSPGPQGPGQPFLSLSFPFFSVLRFVIQTMEKKGKEREKGCRALKGSPGVLWPSRALFFHCFLAFPSLARKRKKRKTPGRLETLANRRNKRTKLIKKENSRQPEAGP
jgi:hypothetical protein